MKIIAHRGLINGPNIKEENNPKFLLNALKLGYDCEVDLSITSDDKWFLGHEKEGEEEKPSYQINPYFILNKDSYNKYWIHCKNFHTLYSLHQINFNTPLNFFYHTTEDVVLTSGMYFWHYPKRVSQSPYGIIVLPEQKINIDDVETMKKYLSIQKFYGICTDYCEKMKAILS